MVGDDIKMSRFRTLPDLSGRLCKAQNHHHSHHLFDAWIRFALKLERVDVKTITSMLKKKKKKERMNNNPISQLQLGAVLLLLTYWNKTGWCIITQEHWFKPYLYFLVL